MKFYQIKIGTRTKRGIFQEGYSIAVRTESERNEVEKYYSTKYIGFSMEIIDIEEVEDLKINKEEGVKKNKEELMESRVSPSFQYGKISGYNARIRVEELPLYDEYREEIGEIHSIEKKIKDDYIKFLQKHFEVKSTNKGSIDNDFYSFYFTPENFTQFKKESIKAKKYENEDLPF